MYAKLSLHARVVGFMLCSSAVACLMPLRICRDRQLRMWNLVKGNCTLTLTLEDEADVVAFAPDGEVRTAAPCRLQACCQGSTEFKKCCLVATKGELASGSLSARRRPAASHAVMQAWVAHMVA